MGNTADSQTARDIYHGKSELALESLTETLEVSRERFGVSSWKPQRCEWWWAQITPSVTRILWYQGQSKFGLILSRARKSPSPPILRCDLLRGRAYQHE